MFSTRVFHRICAFTFVYVTAIEGQNYAERSGNLHADADMFAVTDGEEDYETDYYYYDWSHADAGVRQWNVQDYPHPQSEPWACHRKGPSYVCDPDNILNKQQGDELDMSIRRIFNETKCICQVCNNYSGGIQIGIALLKHTFKPYNEHPSKIIQSFSKNLRSKWNLGECDNDILIVVATEDRQSFTDVGSNTKRHISLREAYKIFLENKALFTDGHYFEGLLGMLENYYQITRYLARLRGTNSKSYLTKGEITGIVIAIILCIFILVITAVFFYKKFKKLEDSNQPCAKVDIVSQRKNGKEYQKCRTDDDVTQNVSGNKGNYDASPNGHSRNIDLSQRPTSDECQEETVNVVYTPPLQQGKSKSPAPPETVDESSDVNKYDYFSTKNGDTSSRSRQLLQTDM